MTDATNTNGTNAPESTAAPVSTNPIVQAAQHDDTKVVMPYEMSFRKVTDANSGVTTKRPTIALSLPYPSLKGIISIIENETTKPKEFALLMSAAYEVIQAQAREIVSLDPSITADNFPYDQVSWEAIANQPESERKGRGIPKETWEGFVADYIAIMPDATSKSPEQITKQAQIFAQKLQPLKNHEDKKKILPKMVELLGTYLNVSKNAEEYSACVEFLMKKADDFLNADNEANLAKNLGF